ncbi:MAG: hypothetical protein AAFY17_02215 [Cyanobacteria bacterium J06642_11]
MSMWRRAIAFMLPLSLLSCSTVEAISPVTEPEAKASSSETVISLNPVPPNGFEALDESALRYFQSMGPLEYAARLGGNPDVPIWRVRLRFVPVRQDADLLYQVQVDHYNLSPTLYADLVNSYGAENADPSLDNNASHQHLDLEFFPVMNVAADWLSDATQSSSSDVTANPSCGLGDGCAELDDPFDREWADIPAPVFETAPWDSDSDPLPTLVRALAHQAGWMQDGWWTMPNEIPEGISNERPWVEILVTNYAGNGGGYTAQWIERAADDSVRAVVHQLYYTPERVTDTIASQGYICARGTDAGKVRTLCP